MVKYDFIDPKKYGIHSQIIKIIGNDKKVLDVGCATGKLAEILTNNGCEVTGIEIDHKSAAIAEKHCKKIIVGDLDLIKRIECPENYFDVILFADILEHLKKPENAIKKLKPYLRKDGLIIVSLPNITHWTIRLEILMGRFNYRDLGILDKTHLKFFTENSTKELITDAGFKILIFNSVPKGYFTSKIGNRIEYSFTKLRPSIFGYQFLIVGKLDE